VLCCALLSFAAGGCAWPQQDIGKGITSPDGVMTARAEVGRLRFGIPESLLMEATLTQWLKVRLVPAEGGRSREIHVPLKQHKAGFWIADHDARLSFSPDSRALAVITQMDIHLIDVATGKRRALTDRTFDVAGFAWLSAGEIAYATQIRSDGKTYFSPPAFDAADYVHLVEFYRRKIAGEATPVRIHALAVPGHLAMAPRPFQPNYVWRPDGRILEALLDKPPARTVFNINAPPGAPR